MDTIMTGSELYENYLEHYQIKGAKHGIRRFQYPDGSLTPEGRARYGVGPARDDKAAKKAKKEKAKREKEARKAEKKASKEADDHEHLMKYLREHPGKAYRHRSQLSEEDVNRLVEQIDFDRKLKDIKTQETQRVWDTVDRFANRAATVNKLMTQTKGIYNTTAAVNNMLIDSGKLNGKKLNTIN